MNKRVRWTTSLSIYMYTYIYSYLYNENTQTQEHARQEKLYPLKSCDRCTFALTTDKNSTIIIITILILALKHAHSDKKINGRNKLLKKPQVLDWQKNTGRELYRNKMNRKRKKEQQQQQHSQKLWYDILLYSWIKSFFTLVTN